MAGAKTGLFCWHELMTSDLKKSVAFYSELFNWKAKEMQMGEHAGVIFSVGDEMIADAMQAPMAGMPTCWIPYVIVADVDKSLKKAEAAGGKTLFPGTDIPEVGRFGMVADCEGAVIAPFKGIKNEMVPTEDPTPPGKFCWHEILTGDPEVAKAFYTALFGWKTGQMTLEGTTYEMFKAGKKELAGVFPKPAEMKGPPMWLSYVSVTDVDQTATRATRMGGQIYQPPTDIPGVGRIATLGDPQGGVIAIYKG